MILETHNGLRNPQRIHVTRVVVYDQFENPLYAAVETDTGIILAESAENEIEFNKFLKGIGINHTVVVIDVQPTALPFSSTGLK